MRRGVVSAELVLFREGNASGNHADDAGDNSKDNDSNVKGNVPIAHLGPKQFQVEHARPH